MYPFLKVTVPLPNISQNPNVTIKEGLEASLEELERPGGHRHKSGLTPPTKKAAELFVRKIPPDATGVLRNSENERKFRREKKKKLESNPTPKKKKRLSTKKKSRRDKEISKTSLKPPFYPTPRPDQQKEYTYILNHTELVPIEPEAPEPIFWNKEALKLKILDEQGSKGKQRRRKTLRPHLGLTNFEGERDMIDTGEGIKDNLKTINFRQKPLDEGFGMRYQTIEDTKSSRYPSFGSQRARLSKENYKNSKRIFSDFGFEGKPAGRTKTRNSILSFGDDYSNIIKKGMFPSVGGMERRTSTNYNKLYEPGQNRRSSYFEQEDGHGAAAFYERIPSTKRYKQDRPRLVRFQRESPRIVGLQRERLETIGLRADPDRKDVEYGFVPSPASTSTLASSGKEPGLIGKKLKNSRIRNWDSAKVFNKPTRQKTTKKSYDQVLSLGQPKMFNAKSKSSINDMKLLDYYRSEYSLDGDKENSSNNVDANGRPIKWKSKKFYTSGNRQRDQINKSSVDPTVDDHRYLKGLNSLKKIKPSTSRRSFYEVELVQTNPIHVDKFVSHSSTGEGVEENVYIVYPDRSIPDKIDPADIVYPDNPTMRTGRTISKVCSLHIKDGDDDFKGLANENLNMQTGLERSSYMGRKPVGLFHRTDCRHVLK